MLAPDPDGRIHRVSVPGKLLRDLAEAGIREEIDRKVAPRICGWTCAHLTMTSAPGILGKITTGCGCDMQPVYAAPAA
jgi:hypothetical protein